MSKINYDLTMIDGIVFDIDGVLSPSTVPMGDDGAPRRMVNVKDGYSIQLAVKKGLKIAIIPGAADETLCRRYNALGVKDIYLRAADKMPCLLDWLGKAGLTPDRVAYMGDDIPDIGVMQVVGLPCAPRDADPEVKAIARFITQANGGYGAGRELVEEVLRAKGLWMSHADAFGW
ncbi:MAG: HAD hydrolase family protein [Muribaculaceae bacterium]|nr:HAD hydrolase family protein [Muribaculaceae bacterium]